MSQQQRPFTHHRSVPSDQHQQYSQMVYQTQQVRPPVSEFPQQGASFHSTTQGSHYSEDHGYLSPASSSDWHQQYGAVRQTPQARSSVHNALLNGLQGGLHVRNPNDAPWIPGSFQQPTPQLFDGAQFRTGSGAATVVPDTRSCLESSAHDSAYYSHFSHKRRAEADDVSSQIPDRFFGPQLAVGPGTRGNKSPRSTVSDGQLHKRTKRSAESRISCPIEDCDKTDLKNQSDLQKHLNQHNKPFHCEEPGCERREGFGTTNDRERHRASVHGLPPRCGTTVGFICIACEQTNPIQKWWPRKDNYKSHIKRKHPEWDMESLIEVSSRNGRPPGTYTEILSTTSHQGNNEELLQSDLLWNGIASSQADNELLSPGNVGDIVAEGGQWADSATNPAISYDSHTPSAFDQYAIHRQPPMIVMRSEMPPAESMLPPAGLPSASRLQRSTSITSVSPRQLERPKQSQPTDRLHIIGGNMHTASQSSNGGPLREHVCTQCGKVKLRACDLRKHEKRHSRPYGCTFPRCDKRFGSRNDWKRHESGQHHVLEQWRCPLPGLDGVACGKLFNEQGDMSAHLDTRHGNEGYRQDRLVHWDAISASHIGPGAHHSFWCGFCRQILPRPESKQRGKSQGKADARSQHIGDHYDQGTNIIEDWIDIEENKPKQDITARTLAQQATTDSSAEDSDLPDQGFPDPVGSASGHTAPLSRLTGGSAHLKARVLTPVQGRVLDLDEDADGESDNDL